MPLANFDDTILGNGSPTAVMKSGGKTVVAGGLWRVGLHTGTSSRRTK